MPATVETVERLVATSGQIKVVSVPDAELSYPEQLHHRMFRIVAQMHGVESLLCTMGLSQLEDLRDAVSDLLIHLDTQQH